ncbi:MULTISPECIES: hypothetical protein, partial [unclassified Aeromonas]
SLSRYSKSTVRRHRRVSHFEVEFADNELQALTQKLEKARALKQGMMQQLLTGKIRLPLAAGA